MPNDHAKLSPSSAERWFNCAGSLNLIATLPPTAFKSNKYAVEGTVAHGLAEDFVTGALPLAELFDRVGTSVMQDGFDIEVTDAMAEGVIEYADHIAALRKRLGRAPGGGPPVVGKAETRVWVGGEGGEVYGTADYLLYQKGHELHVVDFKFGKGVVEAEENKQGLIYVVAAQDSEAGTAYDKAFFHIVQPRARHDEGTVRSWEISAAQLREFRKELAAAVARTKDQKAPRHAGTWCKFCPAIAHCAEAAGAIEKAIGATFTKLPVVGVGTNLLPDVATLTPDQIARVLDAEDMIDSFVEACRNRAFAELSQDANTIPGYKLVEGKANRQWGDEATAEAAFAMLGEDRYNKKLKSPAQMEKIGGKDEVAKYAVKPAGKLTVAKASDKRAQLAPAGKAAEVFGKIETETEENIFGDLAGPSKPSKAIWPQ